MMGETKSFRHGDLEFLQREYSGWEQFLSILWRPEEETQSWTLGKIGGMCNAKNATVATLTGKWLQAYSNMSSRG